MFRDFGGCFEALLGACRGLWCPGVFGSPQGSLGTGKQTARVFFGTSRALSARVRKATSKNPKMLPALEARLQKPGQAREEAAGGHAVKKMGLNQMARASGWGRNMKNGRTMAVSCLNIQAALKPAKAAPQAKKKESSRLHCVESLAGSS